MSVRVWAVFAIIALAAAPAHAAFVAYETFDSYTSGGQLVGQGGWLQTGAGNPAALLTNPPGIAQSQTGLAGAANRPLGALSIPEASTAATYFWQFSASATGNWNMILTDVVPADTAGSSEVQFNVSSATFGARNAGAFKALSTDGTAAGNIPQVANALYNVWFEINNTANTYSVFMQSDTVPAIATRTQALANDGTGGVFTFRNGVAANDLTNVNFGQNTAVAAVINFDNFYVDLAGINPANPVPEPSTIALLAMGAIGMAGVWRRRRS